MCVYVWSRDMCVRWAKEHGVRMWRQGQARRLPVCTPLLITQTPARPTLRCLSGSVCCRQQRHTHVFAPDNRDQMPTGTGLPPEAVSPGWQQRLVEQLLAHPDVLCWCWHLEHTLQLNEGPDPLTTTTTTSQSVRQAAVFTAAVFTPGPAARAAGLAASTLLLLLLCGCETSS